jgi:hypothetical protein
MITAVPRASGRVAVPNPISQCYAATALLGSSSTTLASSLCGSPLFDERV